MKSVKTRLYSTEPDSSSVLYCLEKRARMKTSARSSWWYKPDMCRYRIQTMASYRQLQRNLKKAALAAGVELNQ